MAVPTAPGVVEAYTRVPSDGNSHLPTRRPPLDPGRRMTSRLIQRGLAGPPVLPHSHTKGACCPSEGTTPSPAMGSTPRWGSVRELRDATHGRHVERLHQDTARPPLPVSSYKVTTRRCADKPWGNPHSLSVRLLPVFTA